MNEHGIRVPDARNAETAPSTWIAPVPVLSVLVASLVAFLVCARIVRRARRRARREAAGEIAARIAGHDLWTGVWLVGIPRSRAREARERASSAAKRPGSPEAILDVWESAGGTLLSHVPGPPVLSEAEASHWVERASDDLADAPVNELYTRGSRSVFALVYAVAAAPPARAESLSDLRARLLGESCIGAAFVACPDPPAASAGEPGVLRAIAIARWAFSALVVGSAVYAAVALANGAESWRPSVGAPGGTGESVETGSPPGAGSTAGVTTGHVTTGAHVPTAQIAAAPDDAGASDAGQTANLPEDAGAAGAGQTANLMEDAGATGAGQTTSPAKDAGAADAGPTGTVQSDAGAAGAGPTGTVQSDAGAAGAGQTTSPAKDAGAADGGKAAPGGPGKTVKPATSGKNTGTPTFDYSDR